MGGTKLYEGLFRWPLLWGYLCNILVFTAVTSGNPQSTSNVRDGEEVITLLLNLEREKKIHILQII